MKIEFNYVDYRIYCREVIHIDDLKMFLLEYNSL